ncbi:hypothetical protein ASD39_15015 [Sphingomonas sp. Root50]|nr:hypothetical protein ASD17_11815 [Sphingomonas sp. Root1294]KQY65436.1 hypothetical protein ASD39_15015 [Sphingomonas sp. Root50]KRB95266.1 hypothetical protein ASE22_05040 [Sphingomonas sp. Root720]
MKRLADADDRLIDHLMLPRGLRSELRSPCLMVRLQEYIVRRRPNDAGQVFHRELVHLRERSACGLS